MHQGRADENEMKKSLCILLLICVSLLAIPERADAMDPATLAAQWKPLIYQQNRLEKQDIKLNVSVPVDYDHDWRTNNNWYNFLFFPLQEAMYYSVVESETHYYIGYYQYYPRYTAGREQEHDFTGILLSVLKNAAEANPLEAVISYSNHHWEYRKGNSLCLKNNHPLVKIASSSHEIDFIGKSNRNFQEKTHNDYALVPLLDLWDRRQDIGPGRLFSQWGYFDSLNVRTVAAPWLWNYRTYNWLSKPEELFKHIQGNSIFKVPYIANPYQLIQD